ncbi:cupin-like domain-containing protein [Robertkochia flava]|uniref:cupin-like domain-containing protein n=1 Tax=Robertkochia flava TaxID=3447986 RepID=UPI001CCB0449|nr:cupin-like domain-containing protein [Robertkochia marina]
MEFAKVEKVEKLDPLEFYELYLRPCKPVIFKDLASEWAAVNKWTLEFFKERYGHWEVPMYDSSYHNPGKGYMKPVVYKKFGDYLDLIAAGSTDLRFHNFQIMKRAPELSGDFQIPDIMDGFLRFALMFFGGKGAALNLHYDIDCSHVFLTHFQTQKKVFLFSPDQGPLLYHLPFTNHAHVNVLNPDFEKYPAFRMAEGLEAIIEHGETLFIPKLWWHFVYYSESGFSLALRANDSWATKTRGIWNLVRLFTMDNGMNLLAGNSWKTFKEQTAHKRAANYLNQNRRKSA